MLLALCLIVCVGFVFFALGARERAQKARLEAEYRRLLDKYPLAQTDVVEACAEEFGLSPSRLYAVMLCESSFRTDVVSSAGTIGLMQILPSTGEWIAGKLGEKDTFTEDALYDPLTNARYGSWYLSYLDRRFSGDLVKATAAYHSGQNQVDEWVKETGELTIADIPSEVTRQYVQKVIDAIEIYEQLYFSEES